MNGLFFHILGMSTSQLTHIFQRGRLKPPTRDTFRFYSSQTGQSDAFICLRARTKVSPRVNRSGDYQGERMTMYCDSDDAKAAWKNQGWMSWSRHWKETFDTEHGVTVMCVFLAVSQQYGMEVPLKSTTLKKCCRLSGDSSDIDVAYCDNLIVEWTTLGFNWHQRGPNSRDMPRQTGDCRCCGRRGVWSSFGTLCPCSTFSCRPISRSHHSWLCFSRVSCIIVMSLTWDCRWHWIAKRGETGACTSCDWTWGKLLSSSGLIALLRRFSLCVGNELYCWQSGLVRFRMP